MLRKFCCPAFFTRIATALLCLPLCLASAAAESPAATKPVVEVKTNLGAFQLELYPEQAPVTVNNFLSLVDEKFYDGLTFHRVAPNFVIQAGGYDAQLNYRMPPRTVPNESFNGLQNRKGFAAMARLGDPDSADSQFFINVKDNGHLDPRPGMPGYTVFGRVIAGWSVVEDIELVDTGVAQGMVAVPLEPIIIESIERLATAN